MKPLYLLFILFSCCCSAQQSMSIDSILLEEDYLSELKEQLMLRWPNNRTINIVFHGHSVPSGYFTGGRVHTLAAYPHLFLKFLKEKYPKAVINSIITAIGGEQSEQGAKRFESDVLSLKPDLIFIDYALNDRNIGIERAEIAWKAMIEQALAKQIKIVLLTPTPDLTEDILDEKAQLMGHTKMIKRLGEMYQIPVIEVYNQFKALKHSGIGLNTYMSQSNHPNELGHQIVLLEIVKSLFNQQK